MVRSFFCIGVLAGRMMDPSVRARRLRRSPTEGTPSGVSVDSRQERRTHRFAPLWSNGTRADNSPKKRYRPFARNIPAAGFRLWCAHFFACGVLAGRKMIPSVRPIAEQWHEAALPPKYSRHWGVACACSFFCIGVLAGRMKDPSVRPIAEQWHEAALPPKYSRRWGFACACSFFCMWRPCRADEGPVGSPHCGAMARGGFFVLQKNARRGGPRGRGFQSGA